MERTYYDFDLGEFRWLAAGYIKLILRARLLNESGFLTRKQIREWQLEAVGDSSCRFKDWELLEIASRRLAKINSEFICRCGSGGVPAFEKETPLDDLVFKIAFFVDHGSSGPYHNNALRNAVHDLVNDKAIDWQNLARWEFLDAIRSNLNSLPERDAAKLEDRVNRFTKKGNDWEITFDGDKNIFCDNIGFFLLHYLVQNENRQVSGFGADEDQKYWKVKIGERNGLWDYHSIRN